MESYRVWAEIDLDALTRNLAAIRRRAGPGVRVMLVVKADAYGHGAVAIAHHALRAGVGALGVGTSAEALELRRSGLRVPILVLGTIVDDEAGAILRNHVHVGLHSLDRAAMLQDLGARLGVPARVHVNVDTGMGRLGVSPSRALDLLAAVDRASHLELAGLMTHFSAPQGFGSDSSAEQLRRFEAVLAAARPRGLLRGWIHAANSAALFTAPGPLYDTVRPGIAAYGILPGDLPGSGELEPVMSLRSQVVFLKDLPAGAPVGYGSTWRAPRPTRLATIPVGYHDGLSWRLSNRGEVLVRGRRAPIVGSISMDYTTVDVGHLPGVAVGDTVTFIGRDGDARIAVEDLARWAGTIPYEVTCSIGDRVERVHRGGEALEVPGQAAGEAPERRSRAGAPDGAAMHGRVQRSEAQEAGGLDAPLPSPEVERCP